MSRGTCFPMPTCLWEVWELCNTHTGGIFSSLATVRHTPAIRAGQEDVGSLSHPHPMTEVSVPASQCSRSLKTAPRPFCLLPGWCLPSCLVALTHWLFCLHRALLCLLLPPRGLRCRELWAAWSRGIRHCTTRRRAASPDSCQKA